MIMIAINIIIAVQYPTYTPVRYEKRGVFGSVVVGKYDVVLVGVSCLGVSPSV